MSQKKFVIDKKVRVITSLKVGDYFAFNGNSEICKMITVSFPKCLVQKVISKENLNVDSDRMIRRVSQEKIIDRSKGMSM